MKFIARFMSMSVDEFGIRLLQQIRRLVPDGRAGDSPYRITLDTSDPQYLLLRKILEENGLRPWSRFERERERGIEFRLRLERIYDSSDFLSCSYVIFSPRCIYKLEMGDSLSGMKSINGGELDPKLNFLQCNDSYFCSSRAKDILEMAGLIGLTFKPTILRKGLKENSDDVEVDAMGEVIPWEGWGRPWWQMIADRLMPPLSPSMTFIKSRLNEHSLVQSPLQDPDYCYTPYDGLHLQVELHYRAADLAEVEPLDYARTLEKLGATTHPIIVSKRYYDLCKQHGLESNWIPVRLDA